MNLVKASLPILAILLLITAGFAKDDVSADVAADLKAKFLANYKPAVEKLESFYGASIIRFTRVNGSETTEWIFKGAKPHFRLDNADSTRVSVVSPVRSFRLARESPSDPFAISEAGADYESALDEWRATVRVPWAPFSRGEYTVVSILQLPQCQIQKLEDVEVDNRKLVKLHCKFQVAQRVGWFLFDPDNCWALMGFESWPEGAPAFYTRERLEYGGKSGDVPLLTKAAYYNQVHPKPYLSFEVTEIQPAAVSPDEFDLAKLLHARVGKNEEPSRGNWLFGLILGLILFMIILAVIRHYQGKAASEQQQTP
jgi:hypothetical protein